VRWVLFVNAPIGVALAIATPLVLAESSRSGGRLAATDAVTSTVGMAAFVYGFIHAANPASGWGDPATLVSLAIAVVLLTTFVVMQSRSAYAVMLIVGAAVFAMFFFLTQYVQKVMGLTPIKAGFAFLRVSATIVVVAQVVSRLVTKVPTRALIARRLVVVRRRRPAEHHADRDRYGHRLRADHTCSSGHAAANDARAHAATLHQPALGLHAFTHGADMAFLAGAILAAVGFVVALSLISVRREGAEAAPALPG
jgi:hypothetical protein